MLLVFLLLLFMFFLLPSFQYFEFKFRDIFCVFQNGGCYLRLESRLCDPSLELPPPPGLGSSYLPAPPAVSVSESMPKSTSQTARTAQQTQGSGQNHSFRILVVNPRKSRKSKVKGSLQQTTSEFHG